MLKHTLLPVAMFSKRRSPLMSTTTEGGPISKILVNGNCRVMENGLILCITFADIYAAANNPDYRFTKSTRDGDTIPTNKKANPLSSDR